MANVSKAELAHRLKVKRQYVYALGRQRRYNLDNLTKIAEAVGMKLEVTFVKPYGHS